MRTHDRVGLKLDSGPQNRFTRFRSQVTRISYSESTTETPVGSSRQLHVTIIAGMKTSQYASITIDASCFPYILDLLRF